MKVYLLVGTELFKSGLYGVFSKKEDAEEQKARIEELIKSYAAFCMTKFEIIEMPFDSTELIDKGIEEFKKEAGLD